MSDMEKKPGGGFDGDDDRRGARLFIVQGKSTHLESLYEDEQNPTDEYDSCWTCPKDVRPNDLMLIYLLSPVSAIVGYARFASEPFINEEIGSEWRGKRMAVYRDLSLLNPENFITLGEMRAYFPDWFWVNRPQGATVVPDGAKLQIREPLLTLLAERAGVARESIEPPLLTD